MALVAWSANPASHPGAGLLAKIVNEGHDRFDFVVVSRSMHPSLRPLVEWRRAPTPLNPLRLAAQDGS